MPNPQTNQEWIDGFLRGQLSAVQKANFRQKLENDTVFSTLFEEQKILADGLRFARLSEQVDRFQRLNTLDNDQNRIEETTIGEAVRVKKNLEVLERFKTKSKAIDEKRIVLKNRKKTNWLIAASLLFIISSLGVSFWINQNFSNTALVQKYSYEIDFNTIRASDTEAIINTEILNAYLNKNYNVANSLLQAQKETPSIQLQLLQGYLYLQLNEPQKAILEFSKIEATNDLRFTDNVKWYQALAYLQMGEVAKSKRRLKMIIENKKPWYEAQAKALLKTLDHPLRKVIN